MFSAKALAQAINLQLVDEEWRWHKSAQDFHSALFGS